MRDVVTAQDWAEEVFGHAELGDARRTRRLVRIATDAAERPGGKVLEVCRSSATQQGAYDLLSNANVAPSDIQAAVTKATAWDCAGEEFVFVAIDGTALTLTDWYRRKDFGAVGSTNLGARGLKVINSYAITSTGTPIGILGQQWWKREACRKRTDCDRRPVDQKETKYWLQAIRAAELLLTAVGTRAWFVIDREGDRYATLKALHDSGQWFTVRSTYGHRFLVGERRNVRLRHKVARAPVRVEYDVSLPRRFNRKRRVARMLVRTVPVTLKMREPYSGDELNLPVNIVDARETGTVPRGEKPVHWRLLTNRPVRTDDDVRAVLHGYTQRWKIEELHRTWKSGACRVEESQLRTAQAVMKWAIIMVATASRIERIKNRARNDPNQSAKEEFSSVEIAAVVLLRKRYRRKNEPEPSKSPTMGEVVQWIAELGGYTGKSSGGPPGAITIRRGLDLVAPLAAGLEQLAEDGKL